MMTFAETQEFFSTQVTAIVAAMGDSAGALEFTCQTTAQFRAYPSGIKVRLLLDRHNPRIKADVLWPLSSHSERVTPVYVSRRDAEDYADRVAASRTTTFGLQRPAAKLAADIQRRVIDRAAPYWNEVNAARNAATAGAKRAIHCANIFASTVGARPIDDDEESIETVARDGVRLSLSNYINGRAYGHVGLTARSVDEAPSCSLELRCLSPQQVHAVIEALKNV